MMKVLKKKRKGGFTLIELIVVIAILGILAAIAIPRLGGFRASSQLAADRSTAAVIAKAAEVYAAGLNMTDAQKANVTIANLTGGTNPLLNATEIVPQSGITFTLAFSTTDKLFYVSDGTDVLYPENVTPNAP